MFPGPGAGLRPCPLWQGLKIFPGAGLRPCPLLQGLAAGLPAQVWACLQTHKCKAVPAGQSWKIRKRMCTPTKAALAPMHTLISMCAYTYIKAPRPVLIPKMAALRFLHAACPKLLISCDDALRIWCHCEPTATCNPQRIGGVTHVHARRRRRRVWPPLPNAAPTKPLPVNTKCLLPPRAKYCQPPPRRLTCQQHVCMQVQGGAPEADACTALKRLVRRGQ